MIFSVFNIGTKMFDYYESPVTPTAHATKPPSSSRVKAGMGVAADQAGWRLPTNAKHVGSGVFPRGRITTGSGGGGVGLGDISDPTNLLALGILGWVGYKWFYKGQKPW